MNPMMQGGAPSQQAIIQALMQQGHGGMPQPVPGAGAGPIPGQSLQMPGGQPGAGAGGSGQMQAMMEALQKQGVSPQVIQQILGGGGY